MSKGNVWLYHALGTGFGFLLLQGESMTMGALTWDNIKLGWFTYTLRGWEPYHHGATFWYAGSYGPGEGAKDSPILQVQHEMVWVTISKAWLKETSVFIPMGHTPPRPHLLLMLLYLWTIFFPTTYTWGNNIWFSYAPARTTNLYNYLENIPAISQKVRGMLALNLRYCTIQYYSQRRKCITRTCFRCNRQN